MRRTGYSINLFIEIKSFFLTPENYARLSCAKINESSLYRAFKPCNRPVAGSNELKLHHSLGAFSLPMVMLQRENAASSVVFYGGT